MIKILTNGFTLILESDINCEYIHVRQNPSARNDV